MIEENTQATTVKSVAGVDPEIRLEMLVGYLADQMHPIRELVDALRLQSNASHTTRSKLEHLLQLAGSMWERLGDIREEARLIRAEIKGEPT
jgi:hypothetical protein